MAIGGEIPVVGIAIKVIAWQRAWYGDAKKADRVRPVLTGLYERVAKLEAGQKDYLRTEDFQAVLEDAFARIADQADAGRREAMRSILLIDCDASTITVSISQDAVHPAIPQLSYPINVEQTIGDAFAYVGFTGGTGGGFQNQDILSRVYLDHSLATDAGVPSLDGGDLPDGGGSRLDASLDGARGDASLDGARGDRPTSNNAGAAGHVLGCGCDAGGGGASLGIVWLLGALLLALGARRPARMVARRGDRSPSGR